MFSLRTSALVALSAFAFSALADAPAPTLEIARLQGSLSCSLSKASGGQFDCNVHVKGIGKMNIDLMAETDKNGNTVGYYGLDRLTENGLNYTLVVQADTAMTTTGVVLVTDNFDPSSTTLQANVAAVETGAVKAANISPIKVTFVDADSVNVELGFTLYGPPRANVMSGNNKVELIQLLTGKIRPYVLSLMK